MAARGTHGKGDLLLESYDRNPNMTMSPIRFLTLVACAIIFVDLGGCGSDEEEPSSKLAAVIVLPQDGMRGIWADESVAHPYAIQHLTGTDGRACRLQPQNALTLSFEVSSPDFLADNPAAHWAVTLRNDTTRLDGLSYEPGTGRIVTGHGIATGMWKPGDNNIPESFGSVYAPVLELFNKGVDEPILLIDSVGAAVDDRLLYRYEITSRVDRGRKTVQYRQWVFRDGMWHLLFASGEREDGTTFDPQGGDISFITIFFNPDLHPLSSQVTFANIEANWSCD